MAYSSLRRQRLPANRYTDERYVLNGLNLSTPDQIIDNGESPMALNVRMFAREFEDKRVAIKTRKGAAAYTIPVGQTLNNQQIATTGASNQSISTVNYLAQKVTFSSPGSLTRLDVNIRQGTGRGTVIAELWTNNAGRPGLLLTTSGTPGSSIVAGYAYVTFRFIDAPAVTATDYWLVVYSQDDNTGGFELSSTTAASTALTSNTSGDAWTPAAFSLNYKTYLSTSTPVRGYTRRYAANGTVETHMIVGTDWYKVNDTDGSVTSIKSGLNPNTDCYFTMFNDKTIMVDGLTAWSYDGTTVTVLTGAPTNPTNVIAHKGRVFFQTAPNEIRYSNLQDENTYDSVNLLYVPSPKSSDPIVGWVVFQDNLTCYTKETKYVIYGSDITSFTVRQSIGTKGAVHQNAIYSDDNFVYSVAEEGPYRWNGSTDDYLGDKIQPEFDSIQDKSRCTLIVWNNGVRIYYPDAGSAYNNKMLLLDLVYNQWFMDDGCYTTLPFIFKQDIGNPLYEASSVTGAIYKAEQAYSNLGAPFWVRYWTPYNKYLSGASKDRIKVFRPIIRPSGFTFTMQIGKDINFQNSPEMKDFIVQATGATWGGGWTWGALSINPAEWGSSTITQQKTSMSGRGLHTQYRFERYGANTPVELYGYISILKSGRIK